MSRQDPGIPGARWWRAFRTRWCVIPKSGHRFSEKITHNKKLERDDDSTKNHPALAADAPLLRARERAALRPRLVVRVAFLPPMAGLLSRRPRAPTRDLPSRSC